MKWAIVRMKATAGWKISVTAKEAHFSLDIPEYVL
jgi:hypothetical protein